MLALTYGLLSAQPGIPGVVTGQAASDPVLLNGVRQIQEGRKVFRHDTFGDEAFWGDVLKLHVGIAGVSPSTALAVGLKVDADALPPNLVAALRHGQVNLDDPAVTLELLRLNAVVGVTGFLPTTAASNR